MYQRSSSNSRVHRFLTSPWCKAVVSDTCTNCTHVAVYPCCKAYDICCNIEDFYFIYTVSITGSALSDFMEVCVYFFRMAASPCSNDQFSATEFSNKSIISASHYIFGHTKLGFGNTTRAGHGYWLTVDLDKYKARAEIPIILIPFSVLIKEWTQASRRLLALIHPPNYHRKIRTSTIHQA